MLLVSWLILGSALADPGILLGKNEVCAASDRVALSPELQRRWRPSCASVVSAQSVQDYLKAFAVLSGELQQVATAQQLVRHVEARWLVIEVAKEIQVFDAQVKDFVDPAVLTRVEPAPPAQPLTSEQAAEVSYQEAYRDLKAKRHERAKVKLTECLALDANHVGCHWEMGWVHWVAEDWAGVVTSWEHVERIDRSHAELEKWLPKARAKLE